MEYTIIDQPHRIMQTGNVPEQSVETITPTTHSYPFTTEIIGGPIIVGTCGKCGGPIVLPKVWSGMCPPERCQNCGRAVKPAIGQYGPVREMSDV
jgi:hypothetical protein